jgi:regulator of RNase E activity RraA
MELTERLAGPSASQISGRLGAAALPRDGLLDLYPIQADRIVGRAFTVYLRLAAEAADREVEYISDMGPGGVAVLQTTPPSTS